MLQARRSVQGGSAKATKQKGLIFWTITVWPEEETMRVFRNGGAHRKAMSKLAHWCDEATYVHWLQVSDDPPDLTEAHRRLVHEGVVSRVKFPSEKHASRDFEAPEEAD